MENAFQWVITIAVALACLAFIVQAGFVIAMYRTARRIEARVTPLAERAGPILATARQMLEETRPRLAELSTEALEIARTAKAQAARISDLVEDTAARARIRIAQIDERVDTTVEQVEQVKGAVLRPVREMNAVMAGVKAAVAAYLHGGRRYSVDTATQDEEMFI